MQTHSPSSRRAEECWKLPELHMQHRLCPSKEEEMETLQLILQKDISSQPSSATSFEFKFPRLPAKLGLLPLVKTERNTQHNQHTQNTEPAYSHAPHREQTGQAKRAHCTCKGYMMSSQTWKWSVYYRRCFGNNTPTICFKSMGRHG